MMSHRTDHSSFGPHTGGEYAGGLYLKYRTHLSSFSDRHSKKCQNMTYIPHHNVAFYRVHSCQGTFGNSNLKHSSSGHGGCTVGNIHGSHRCHISSSGDHTGWKNDNMMSFNEKKTMQSLNGRLASYLENVKSLDEENVMLEKKICEWYEKNAGTIYPDFSQYFKVIKDLQNQVLSVTAHNVNLAQQIDDGHINADDYRKKYETEFKKRTGAENNLCNHYGLLEDINMDRQALVTQIQYLEEELLQLKNTSEEEINCLQTQLGTRVNVKVETAPSIDLNKALSEIRKEYEVLMERNLSDIETMFHKMSSELTCTVNSGVEQLQLFSNEVIDLKLCVHTMETELKKQLNMISVHECSLAELHEYYSSHLNLLQGVIDISESQLAQIQSKLKEQNYENKFYMDQKTCLEKEINMYRHLLEGYDTDALTYHPTREKDGIHPGKLQK